MVRLQGKASRLPISTACCQSWKKHVGARLRMLVSNGAWKSRPYDVAKVGMRLSPRLMLLVLAFTRCWRPELCMLPAQREHRSGENVLSVRCFLQQVAHSRRGVKLDALALRRRRVSGACSCADLARDEQQPR